MELHRSVSGYFHEVLTEALTAQKVEAGEPTEFYLVNLLTEFTATPQLMDEPLSLRLAETTTASPAERRRGLKEIGDTSLYVSGFFADSLARRMVGVEYYMSIGERAYSQLAHVAGGDHGEVYDELADKFTRFVDVLAEIRGRTNIAGSTNLLRLYEAWLETGSDWMERRLRAAGMIDPAAARRGSH
ncbi:MAG: hypothetical protein EXR73_09175 [Myxococcales bacterium]|nr:hypothetical protein [Myxococcales bacterium]